MPLISTKTKMIPMKVGSMVWYLAWLEEVFCSVAVQLGLTGCSCVAVHQREPKEVTQLPAAVAGVHKVTTVKRMTTEAAQKLDQMIVLMFPPAIRCELPHLGRSLR